MANIKSAKKRARQSVKRRAHNMSRRSMLRTSIKRVLEAIQVGEGSSASAVYVSTCSVLDKAVKAGLIHKNKAARHKSHLSQKLKAIGAPAPTKKVASSEAKPVKTEKKAPKATSTKKSEKVEGASSTASTKKTAAAKPKAKKETK